MLQNAHDAYLDSRILAADPLELVTILYQACTNSVREARQHLANREIAARSKSITKAWEILAELTTSLDRQRGGEISERLAELYDYMMRRLTEANSRQIDEPLAEVLGLLGTLLEGWQGIQKMAVAAAPAASRSSSAWGNPVAMEAAAASSYGSGSYSPQGWSF